MSFKRVRDWDALECQRHICEIQGLSLFRSKNNEFVSETELKLTDLYRKPSLSTYDSERKSECGTGTLWSASATSARSKVSFPPSKRRICTRNRA